MKDINSKYLYDKYKATVSIVDTGTFSPKIMVTLATNENIFININREQIADIRYQVYG